MSQRPSSIPGQRNHRPLNVLFISHDAHPNGAQNLLIALSTWLIGSGLVNPRFVLAGSGSLEEEFLRLGPVLRLESDRPSKSTPDMSLRLLRSFCGDDLSAVYLNSAASGHLIETTRHLKVPQIAHVHELEKSIERWVGPEKIAALRDHAHLFIAASLPVANNLLERHGISKQRLKVVDAFIKCTGVRKISDSERRSCKLALGLPPDAKVVLGCGTTDWRKGPDLFVEVAKALRLNNIGPLRFVWVGGETQSGEISTLKELANASGVGDQVSFVGEVSTPLPYMIASDVFLLPSREDPFPLVCLESADCGVPTICFADAGGMPDFVGSTCGAVVPYLSIQEMAGELSLLLSNDAKARRLGEQAREKVRRQLDVSVKGQEIYEILRNLCESPKGNGVH